MSILLHLSTKNDDSMEISDNLLNKNFWFGEFNGIGGGEHLG